MDFRVLGQNGILPKLNIKTRLLLKLLFKVVPINPHKHKNHFFILFLFTFPISNPVLCSIFLFKPYLHQWATMRKRSSKLQSIKVKVGPNLLFVLFYVKFLALSFFFSLSRNLSFQEKKIPLFLLFSFVYVLHDYFSINGLLSSKDSSP